MRQQQPWYIFGFMLHHNPSHCCPVQGGGWRHGNLPLRQGLKDACQIYSDSLYSVRTQICKKRGLIHHIAPSIEILCQFPGGGNKFNIFSRRLTGFLQPGRERKVLTFINFGPGNSLNLSQRVRLLFSQSFNLIYVQILTIV